MMKYGISVASPSDYIVYFAVLLLVILPALIGGTRTYCHSICWVAPFQIIGSKLRNALHLPGLRLTSHKDSCNSCGTCTKKCPMSLDVQEMVKKSMMNTSDCIMCGECVDGCGRKAISFTWDNE